MQLFTHIYQLKLIPPTGLYSVLIGQIKEEEILKRAKQKTNETISSIISCTTAMYGDAYHLSNHGIKPLLPYILPQMSLPKEFLPVIRDYYITLVNTALMGNYSAITPL